MEKDSGKRVKLQRDARPHESILIHPLFGSKCRELVQFFTFQSPLIHTQLSVWRQRDQLLNQRARWISVGAKSLIVKEVEELVKK